MIGGPLAERHACIFEDPDLLISHVLSFFQGISTGKCIVYVGMLFQYLRFFWKSLALILSELEQCYHRSHAVVLKFFLWRGTPQDAKPIHVVVVHFELTEHFHYIHRENER